MALWTPYAQEVALDLTKRAVNVESVSPLAACCAPTSPPVLGPLPLYYTGSQHYASYPYQLAPYTVPSPPSLSPDSLGSCSYRKQTAPSPPDFPELNDADTLAEDQEYLAFERDALRAMAEKNGGSLLGNNPRMRRAVQTSQTVDDSYRKQRERNNFAAKMSRDRRKLREARLALQVTFLKKKMSSLKAKLSAGVCGRCGQFRE